MKKIKIRKEVPSKGYASSLIQQDFGELPENHGYLLWDIENGDIKEKNIDNDYKFINIDINQNTNIDNLKINIPKNDKTKVKIKWVDFSVNMNTENERKIREIVKNLTGTDTIKIESHPLYTDINDSKLISDTIDINDNIIQQNVLKEFLLNNKIDANKIENIIEIDNIINKRLNINKSKNIKWSIDKFWFNNFKSYGDNNEINWENKNGIIQIGGINQQGKSTILDAISYILYGTTIATQKREKNGDNRYININRIKNSCDGGAIIDIDGDKYLIYRKTEREIKKNNNISVSTILEYYKGTEIKEENKLVGERKTDTQKQVESILGDFNDFIRLTFTSADNVNDLLSMDRSQFIDNIIKDAGYDVFDKKLNEFKEYKKDLNLEKINLDINKIDKEILDINENLSIHNIEVKDNENNIIEYENIISEKQKEKEILISKLNKIDENIINIDYDKVLNILQELNIDIDDNIEQINKLNFTISVYPDNFDNKLLNDKKNEYEILKDNYLKKINDIKNFENQLNDKKYEIKTIENNIDNKIKEIENSYKNSINLIKNNIKIYENDINIIKRDGLKLKNEIDSLENSDKETKICPTCLKPLNDNDIEHFQKEIDKRKIELKELSINGKKILKEVNNLKLEIERIESLDINDDISFIIFLNDLNIKKDEILKNIDRTNDHILIIKDSLKESEIIIKNLKDDIKSLESEKERFDYRLKIESDIKDIKIKVNDKKEKFNNLKDNINEYKKNKNFIDENKIIEFEIIDINNIIEEKFKNIKSLNNIIIENKQKITLKNKIIQDYNQKIQKYNYQKGLEFIHDTYMKSMHRDGLPTYLLKKSIHIINNELNMLLSDVNFNLHFDDNLNLKMKSKISLKDYNAVEGSGMERTFNSVVLKIALRKINNTSKPDFILFDEIMNKLVDNSVDYFIELLYNLKNHIDKIILIEHIHQLKYDYLINVIKNKDGISSFEFI